jgi:hypothetical protein
MLKVIEDFGTESDTHQDPYQNVTNPEHWLKCFKAMYKLLPSSFIFSGLGLCPGKSVPVLYSLQEAFSHTRRGEER